MQQPSPLDNFTTLSLIGRGSYAKVTLVRKNASGQLFALKSMKKKYIAEHKQTHRILMEKTVLATIRHPFLIRIDSSFQTNDKLFMVLQYCPGGQIFGLLAKQKQFTQSTTRFYAAQIVLALQYLHSKNIIYRDLKPQNILVCADGYIKLTDFGLSKNNIVGQYDTHSIIGTPQYMAPEVIDNTGHGKAVDWWCLGAIIYQFLTGMPPFYSQNNSELYNMIKHGQVTMKEGWSKNLKDLLTQLFLKNPQQRLRQAGSILKHPWFAMIDWKQIHDKQVKAPFIPKLRSQTDVSNFDKEFTKANWHSQHQSPIEQQHLQGFSYEQSFNQEKVKA